MANRSDPKIRKNTQDVGHRALTAVGALIVFCAGQIKSVDWRWIFLKQTAFAMGGVFAATAILQAGWELILKRAFLQEILSIINVSVDFETSGTERIVGNFKDVIDWKELCKDTTEVCIFLAYSVPHDRYTLEQFLQRPRVKLKVILPDWENQVVLNELAASFGQEPEELEGKIKAAADFFKGLTSAKTKVEISLFGPMSPKFSLYQNDRMAIMAMYNHNLDRKPVPTFVFNNNGFMYEWLQGQFRTSKGLSREFN